MYSILFLKWLSNLIFWRQKKVVQVVRIGGRGRKFGQNPKESIFSQEDIPYVIYASDVKGSRFQALHFAGEYIKSAWNTLFGVFFKWKQLLISSYLSLKEDINHVESYALVMYSCFRLHINLHSVAHPCLMNNCGMISFGGLLSE